MVSWDSLIRFVAEDSAEYWAALPLDEVPASGLQVDGFASVEDLESDHGSRSVTVKKLLAPSPNPTTPIYCIGLNYKNHAEEAKLPIPANPPMWYKPATALAHPEQGILFPLITQTSFPDYEGEFTIILRGPIKSISKADVTSAILGYTIGNDLTARLFQDPKKSGGQFTFAKAFDNFAPLGPRLVHPSKFKPGEATVTTRVNGEVVQQSLLDFIFPIEELVHFLAQGTTVPYGSAIMTGTPAGVGWFRKPQVSLKDGDEVEVEIQPIGILKNTIVFEK